MWKLLLFSDFWCSWVGSGRPQIRNYNVFSSLSIFVSLCSNVELGVGLFVIKSFQLKVPGESVDLVRLFLRPFHLYAQIVVDRLQGAETEKL